MARKVTLGPLRNAKMHHLDEKHVVFGQVVKGEEVISHVPWNKWAAMGKKWEDLTSLFLDADGFSEPLLNLIPLVNDTEEIRNESLKWKSETFAVSQVSGT